MSCGLLCTHIFFENSSLGQVFFVVAVVVGGGVVVSAEASHRVLLGLGSYPSPQGV